MAKRTRGNPSRPGQRPRLQRTAAPRTRAAESTETVRPATLTDAEEARAAELEARILAAERSAEEATRRRERGRRPVDPESGVASGTIAMRASDEYAYVMRDVRRIVLIGGSLLILLIALWVVIQVNGGGFG